MSGRKELICISCGGTGGHFYPGLSIAHSIQKQSYQVRLFLSGKHTEDQKMKAAKLHIDADEGPDFPWPIKGAASYPIFIILFFLAIVKSVIYLFRYRPSAVLGMGSFTSLPLGIAALLTGTDLYLHEGNTVVGRANRLLSRWAVKLFASFPLALGQQIKCPVTVCGMPLRAEILSAGQCEARDISDIRNRLGFSSTKPVLFVFGGSQGAANINMKLLHCIELMEGCSRFQIIHLTGALDYDRVTNEYATLGLKVKICVLRGAILRRKRHESWKLSCVSAG